MDLNQQIAVLKQIYAVYSEFISRFTIFCKKYCDTCCTGNVTGTTLEGYYLLKNMEKDQQSIVLEKFASPPSKRFQPKLSFNRIAKQCADGEDIQEAPVSISGKCPVLLNHQCLVYPYRPFGCRCMVSAKPCSETGYADIDPLIFSVNHAFMQLIEHLDAGGLSGNFSDVVNFLAIEKNRKAYENRLQLNHRILIPNISISVLMVPPEHRGQVEALLKQIG